MFCRLIETPRARPMLRRGTNEHTRHTRHGRKDGSLQRIKRTTRNFL
jgi:hypothetical protein